MKAPLFNIKAENLGEVTLPKSVFESKVSQDTISMALRVYQYNLRSAHAKSKDRGEVAGTTKKMWAQKGTGRARHGSAKAPQFVGGGSAHGPQGNQNYQKKLNKKVKTAAINGLYTKFASNKLILVIDQFKDLAPKTKTAWDVMANLENANKTLANSKKIGIITSAPLTNVKRAFANIPGLNYFTLKSVNLLNLADQNFLIFSKKALEDLAK